MTENKFDSYIVPIEKSSEDIIRTVLTNITKMITNRGYTTKEKLQDNIKKVLELYENGETVYKIPIDFNGFKKYIFRYIPHNISTINKASGISDFLHTYKNDLSMVIVDDVSKKAMNDLFDRFPNSQIFKISDLLVDIVSHNLVPEHTLLTKKENDAFYKNYNVKRSHMLKIHYNDPVAKYYNSKPNDIFRIIRPSEPNGYSIVYRLVIKKDHV